MTEPQRQIEREDAFETCTCRYPLYETNARCPRHGHSPGEDEAPAGRPESRRQT